MRRPAETDMPRSGIQQTQMSRRTLLVGAAGAAFAQSPLACNLEGLATPYKLNKLVLRGSGNANEFDRISVDCPFVFHYDARYYMTYVGFDGVGYQTGLASSSDLLEWRKEQCILKRDPNSSFLRYNAALTWILRDNNLYSQGDLKRVDGHFIGAYHAYPNQGYEAGAAIIGLCRSKDLLNWQVEPPCLSPQDGAPWEVGGLYKACLVENQGTYYLFYNAKNQTYSPWHEQTGFATSKDLRSWYRNPGNPLIRNGPTGSLDERFASDPCVLRRDDKWAIYYFGLDAKGVARDLVATTRDFAHAAKCKTPVIDIGSAGTVDSRYAHKASLIYESGVLYHFYCAVSAPDGHEIRGISVARSRPWT